MIHRASQQLFSHTSFYVSIYASSCTLRYNISLICICYMYELRLLPSLPPTVGTCHRRIIIISIGGNPILDLMYGTNDNTTFFFLMFDMLTYVGR